LRNDRNALPLSKEIQSIAVIGPNADDDNLTRYRYGPNAVKGVTVLQGITNKLGNRLKINYAKGCEATNEHWPQTEVLPEPLTEKEKDEIAKAVDAAKRSDVAVVVLGDSPNTVGETASRTSLDLPGRQLELVQAVHATGKPTVVVLLNGRPMSINWIDKYVPGIIEGWFPGAQGGTAIADVLFGDYNPGGRLPVTFYKSADQLPPFTDYGMQGRTYRYFKGEPLYPFGFGLSYTQFSYSNLKLSAGKINAGQELKVTADVANTGDRAGEEVVQLYLTDVQASVPVPIRSLAGFKRVFLKPGEKQSVSFTIASNQMSLIDDNGKRVIEPGEFEISIGGGQATTNAKGAGFVRRRFAVTGPLER
jgi:beta-glucosidase